MGRSDDERLDSAKCGDAEGDLSELCGTGHFGTGRKLVKWISSLMVGSQDVGQVEKTYLVSEA